MGLYYLHMPQVFNVFFPAIATVKNFKFFFFLSAGGWNNETKSVTHSCLILLFSLGISVLEEDLENQVFSVQQD